MRTFKLDRHEDLSGNSGTGIVAEGVEFSDGTVALRWLTDTATSTFYNSIDDVMKLHQHDGATDVVFDEEEKEVISSKKSFAKNLKKFALDLEQSLNLPPRIIRKKVMIPEILEYCPHCSKEIGEKSLYVANLDAKPLIFTHRSCGGLVRSSIESEQESKEFNFFEK